MTAIGTVAPTEGILRLALLGAPQLLVDAVGRLALDSQLEVCGVTSADPPSLAVLVEPASAHWDAVEPLGVPIVVLTSSPAESQMLVDLVARGVEAVLPTACSSGELFAAVRSIGAGGSGFTGAQVRALTSGIRSLVRSGTSTEVKLTAREREILVAIDQGLSVKQVARALSISPRTVENIRRLLYRKLTAKNRSQAIARAHELGLLTDAEASDG